MDELVRDVRTFMGTEITDPRIFFVVFTSLLAVFLAMVLSSDDTIRVKTFLSISAFVTYLVVLGFCLSTLGVSLIDMVKML